MGAWRCAQAFPCALAPWSQTWDPDWDEESWSVERHVEVMDVVVFVGRNRNEKPAVTAAVGTGLGRGSALDFPGRWPWFGPAGEPLPGLGLVAYEAADSSS